MSEMHNCKKECTEVSVAVLTYNPDLKKMLITIESILKQKNVDFEIIISDDGSRCDYMDDAKKLMEKSNFYNYKFAKNVINQGTVANCWNALNASSGKYVKLISPGDYFVGEESLRQWIDYMEEENVQWSFCDAYYYRVCENNQLEILEQTAHPKDIVPYTKKEIKKCCWNYIAFGDGCLGAATLCNRNTMSKYLKKLIGNVIYLEDGMYRMMMADNVPMSYYAKELIMYEYGEGVSTTSSDIWAKRIKADYDSVTQMILREYIENGKMNAKMIYYKAVENTKNIHLQKLKRLFLWGYVPYRIRILVNKRKTKNKVL